MTMAGLTFPLRLGWPNFCAALFFEVEGTFLGRVVFPVKEKNINACNICYMPPNYLHINKYIIRKKK